MFDVPVDLIQPSFSRGEVSPFMFGRVDLTGWAQGLRTCRNFVVRPEGSVSNRQGFTYLNNSVAPNGSTQSKATILLPFVFSATQSYVIEVGAGTAQVFSNGSQVLSGGVPLTFATPWAQSALSTLRWSQSSDTLTVVHPLYPPQEIKRTSANSFTCLPAVYTGGPFLPQNTDGVTFVYASAKSGNVTLTASAAIFNANQVGGLMQLTQQDISTIPPWQAERQIAGPAPLGSQTVGLLRTSNLKNYMSVSSTTPFTGSNTVCTGNTAPQHSQGVQPDGDGNNVPTLGFCGMNWEYQDSGFGVVLITGYISPTQVTGTVQPNYTGGPGLLPVTVVGGPQVTVGPLTFNGTGIATTFGPLTAMTSTDPSKYYVTIGGVYVSPSLYSISAAGGNIVFLNAPAAGTANVSVSQITLLGQTTYWAFGAFSPDQGYPSAVSYFPDRLILAATTKQPVGVFGSATSQYHLFSVSNPVVASDAFTVFLNARQLNAISDLIPLPDLLVGTSNIIWRLWAGSTGTALGPLSISANPQSYFGQSPNCASLMFGDSAIFAEYDGRRLRDLIYQFAYDKYMGQELTLYCHHLIPFGTQFQRIQYKPDPIGQLVFALRTDGVLLCCTYLREQQLVGWSHWDTAGTFEDICVVPEGGSFGLYAITNRMINGAQVRMIERLAQREVQTIYDYKFVDCNLTYDGRNTTAVTMTLTGTTTGLANDTGTLTASSAAGWANFQATDITNSNELWIYQTLTFATSVSGQAGGTLATAVAPGNYTVTFSDGECRFITVAADGLTVTWQGNLVTGSILSPGSILTATCRCRLRLLNYVSATQIQVLLKDPCPLGLQGMATATWTFARTTFTGATQLANASVVALVDANVIGISSNASVPNGALSVSATGVVTLPTAGGVVQIGLPYLSDFETLPLNEQGQQTIRMRAKAEPVIYLDVVETRNFLAGTDFSTANSWPLAQRAFEPYVGSTAIGNGIFWTRVNSELSSECHTCIRQNMPLPMSIRGHIPSVMIGEPVS
jgi:hypothetical protein